MSYDFISGESIEHRWEINDIDRRITKLEKSIVALKKSNKELTAWKRKQIKRQGKIDDKRREY